MRVVSKEVNKGDPIVIQFTDVEHVNSFDALIYIYADDQTYWIRDVVPEVTLEQLVLQTTDLPIGKCSFQLYCSPESGYHERDDYVSVTILPAAEPTDTAEPTNTPVPVTPVPVSPTDIPATTTTSEPTAESTATPVPTMPSTISDSTGSYSIGSDGNATFSQPATSAASVSIPATVTVNRHTVKVTAIADRAFSKANKLTTVTIGKNAFSSCTKLKTVKGGAAVVTIKDGAFNGCKALKTVTVKTTRLTNSSVKAGAFKGIHSKATFKCPKAKLKDYKTLFVKKGAPKTCKFK